MFRFLAENNVYVPTIPLSENKEFSAVGGHPLFSSSKAKISPATTTVAVP